jgi:hypothetical protein
MPSTGDSQPAEGLLDLRIISLAIAIVLSYLIFQLILIFVVTVGLDGDCLYTFWLPQAAWPESPFWLTVTIVSLLLAFSLFVCAEAVQATSISKGVFGIVAIVILGYWLYGMYGLWQAMLYETGALSSEVWFKLEAGRLPLSPWEAHHVCKSGT